jgi:hypothetical protein
VVVGGRTKKIGCCDYEINNLKEKKKKESLEFLVGVHGIFILNRNE